MSYVKDNEHLELFQSMFGKSLVNLYVTKIYCPIFRVQSWVEIEGDFVLEFDTGSFVKIYSTRDSHENYNTVFELLDKNEIKEILENV